MQCKTMECFVQFHLNRLISIASFNIDYHINLLDANTLRDSDFKLLLHRVYIYKIILWNIIPINGLEETQLSYKPKDV